MSLAAQIALEPSRRIAWLERSMPLGGLAVAATCLMARWPGSEAVVAVVALGFALVFVVIVARGRPERLTLFVSARDEVAVASAGGLPPEGWRLDEATLAWPSFAVVSLVRADGGPVQRRAVWAGDLVPRERRALYRFLLWSVRNRRAAVHRVGPRDGA